MKHPYEEYETSKLWKIVKSSIEELVENNDIELFTPIEYIVGYICKDNYFKELVVVSFFVELNSPAPKGEGVGI